MNNEPNRTIVHVQPTFVSDGFDEDVRQYHLAEALNVHNFLHMPSDYAQEALQQAWRDRLQFYGEAYMPIVFVTSLPGEQWMEAMQELNAATQNGDYARLVVLRANKEELVEKSQIPANTIDEWAKDAMSNAARSFQEQFTEEVTFQLLQAANDYKEKKS